MQIKILKFDTHKAALTMASVFALSSLLFLIPFMLIIPLTMQGADDVNRDFSVMMSRMIFPLILMPVLYFIFTYLGVRFSAWVYNKIAGATGGFVFTVEMENDN